MCRLLLLVDVPQFTCTLCQGAIVCPYWSPGNLFSQRGSAHGGFQLDRHCRSCHHLP